MGYFMHCGIYEMGLLDLCVHIMGFVKVLLSGVPDLWDRNKILSGGDHNFQFYFELCTYCNILDIYLS